MKDWSHPSSISGQLHRLGFRRYADYLASDHWQELRREYAERDDLPQRCACGDPYEALHHESYEFLGEEDPADLVPICDECHRRRHRKRPRPARLTRKALPKRPPVVPTADTALEVTARRLQGL